jgi:hypothetical protein
MRFVARRVTKAAPVLLAVLILGRAAPDTLAAPESPPLPCVHPELRQLEFLRGTWKVAGTWLGPGQTLDPVVGESEFSSELGGCLIAERFKGSSKGEPFVILTLFAWEAGQNRFQMTHSDSLHGSLLMFTGSGAEDGLVFEAQVRLSRTITLRQEYRRSGPTFVVERKRKFEDSDAWTTVWKATYEKRP